MLQGYTNPISMQSAIISLTCCGGMSLDHSSSICLTYSPVRSHNLFFTLQIVIACGEVHRQICGTETSVLQIDWTTKFSMSYISIRIKSHLFQPYQADQMSGCHWTRQLHLGVACLGRPLIPARVCCTAACRGIAQRHSRLSLEKPMYSLLFVVVSSQLQIDPIK